jgi:hypothetical protein
MDTKVVLVDGIPGAGKSVAAQTIARRLRAAGQPVRWWYEEEVGHPVYVFRDAAAMQQVIRDLFTGDHARVVAAALTQWARFADDVGRAGTTVVADGTVFGYLTWTLHYLDRSATETLAYARGVLAALAVAQPRLIYLRAHDVAATVRHVLAVRGDGWAADAIQKAVGSPYGRARGLEGVEGLVHFWADYQALADRLFDEARVAKLAVDVAVGEWADVEAAIAAFLALPPAPSIDAGDLGRFVGAYHAPDGSVAQVELAAGGLTVRGVRQVWPGQRLVPVGGDAFDVLSLPFTIRFEGDTMRIEGPELFGGRPPAALVRSAVQAPRV